MPVIVTWKEKNLRLRVIEVFEGKYGETRLAVCKEFADPIMGRFSVRAEDTSLIDFMEVA